MLSIYDPATVAEMTNRIDSLTAQAPRQWGKMNVPQMLAHCTIPLESGLGERISKKNLVAFLFGKLAKPAATNESPLKRSLPTAPDFVVSDVREFETEKQRLISAINRFSKAGAAGMENKPHPFFGKLTAKEWSNLMVKHLDHHLRQFGA